MYETRFEIAKIPPYEHSKEHSNTNRINLDTIYTYLALLINFKKLLESSQQVKSTQYDDKQFTQFP